MSKKKKNLAKIENSSEPQMTEEEIVVASEEAGDKSLPAKEETKVKKVKAEKAVKADKNAKKKEKKPKERKLAKKARETASELKKVTWPTFGEVCKKTGIVLAVVLLFALVLFGLDTLFGFLFGLLR